MNIYFAGAIRGGRKDAELYRQLISHLKNHGTVFTEHIGDDDYIENEERRITDRQIHDRDVNWILKSDVIIAEVTTTSLGVGYEIGRAIENKKPVLCLYRLQDKKQLSSMISGCENVELKIYKTLNDAKLIIDSFLSDLR